MCGHVSQFGQGGGSVEKASKKTPERSCRLGDEDFLFFPPSFFLLPRTWDMISGALAAMSDHEVTLQVEAQARMAESRN